MCVYSAGVGMMFLLVLLIMTRMAPNTHWARILDTPHEYLDTSSTHGAACCNDPTMTSGGDQQLISGKLSRFFDEESRCSNMSSCSMHALTLRMMSFLTVRALGAV